VSTNCVNVTWYQYVYGRLHKNRTRIVVGNIIKLSIRVQTKVQRNQN